ncbi:MAG: cation diffusion facilitator family transporter [Schleiferilactobacillus harbinensis]|jgi:cation diffusion facilitator family transporter|nr:cation diffusion facilitator family transporter [Schleiferilactobacillus harbinensis]
MFAKSVIALYERTHANADEETKRTGLGKVAGIVGLLSNIVLFVIKLAIGLFSGSIAIMADAFNNLSDTAGSIVTLVGFKVAGKRPDRGHPFGHERFEYISGVLVSMLMIFAGLDFVQSSIGKIQHPTADRITFVVLITLLLSIFIKLWQNLFYRQMGDEISSDTLKATAMDSQTDVVATTAVLISAVLSQFAHIQIDGWIGLFVALYLIYEGIQSIRGSVNQLIGIRPSDAEVQKYTDQLSKYDDILGFHDLMIHHYGPTQIFATVHIELDSRWSLDQAHEEIDKIERDFQKKFNVELVGHIDPIDIDDRLTAEVYERLQTIIQEMGGGLHTRDFHIEPGPHHTRIVQFDVVVPDNYPEDDKTLNLRILADLRRYYPNVTTEIDFDHNYLGHDHTVL